MRRWIRHSRVWWLVIGVVLLASLFLLYPHIPVHRASLVQKPKLEVVANTKQVQFHLQTRGSVGVPWKATLYTPAGPLIARGLTNVNSSTLSIRHVRAGVLAYRVKVDQWTFDGTVTRKPGLPITPLDLKVGARAARVVGNRPPALVLHPLDVEQNVSDQPILVRAERPDHLPFAKTIRVKYLTAWTYIPTGLRTGILKISASSAGARGERAEVDVQPGPIASGKLQARNNAVPAKQREWWDLRLENGKDALGNAALNGTAVEFNSVGNQTMLFATRPTVRATASIDLPPTVTPGNYVVRASSETFRSSRSVLKALSSVAIGTQSIRWENPQRWTLQIGPLRDQLGALPDDGTPVKLEVLSEIRARTKTCLDQSQVLYEIILPLQHGALAWPLPPLPANSRCVRIGIAGESQIIPLPAQVKP